MAMIRFLVRTTLSILANTIGLLVASLLLDDFSITGFSFALAVLFFTIATAILGPFIMKIAMKNAPYLMGGIALVTTFVGLLLTQVFTEGINIKGMSTWVIATLVVWLFSVLASVVLPVFLFRKRVENKTEQ
jgi:low temperature requirement protein LtrA